MIEKLIQQKTPFFVMVSNDSLKVGEKKRIFRDTVPIASKEIKRAKYYLFTKYHDSNLKMSDESYRLGEKELKHNEIRQLFENMQHFNKVLDNSLGRVYEFSEFKKYYLQK